MREWNPEDFGEPQLDAVVASSRRVDGSSSSVGVVAGPRRRHPPSAPTLIYNTTRLRTPARNKDRNFFIFLFSTKSLSLFLFLASARLFVFRPRAGFCSALIFGLEEKLMLRCCGRPTSRPGQTDGLKNNLPTKFVALFCETEIIIWVGWLTLTVKNCRSRTLSSATHSFRTFLEGQNFLIQTFGPRTSFWVSNFKTRVDVNYGRK